MSQGTGAGAFCRERASRDGSRGWGGETSQRSLERSFLPPWVDLVQIRPPRSILVRPPRPAEACAVRTHLDCFHLEPIRLIASNEDLVFMWRRY